MRRFIEAGRFIDDFAERIARLAPAPFRIALGSLPFGIRRDAITFGFIRRFDRFFALRHLRGESGLLRLCGQSRPVFSTLR